MKSLIFETPWLKPCFVNLSAEIRMKSFLKLFPGEVRFELFNLARRILETVRENFVNGEVFMNESYGPIIDKAQASRTIRGYLDADPILSTIKVAWSQDITSR